jgi:hypothetical protein
VGEPDVDRIPIARSGRACLAIALLCAGLALAWQSLTVHYNYGGNWSALFCTGSQTLIPPALAKENIYTFPDSTGYDGQFYHYMAHDPVPALAFSLAGGEARRVDVAYFFVILLFVFHGAYWLSRYATLHGATPIWGFGFLCVPAVIISLDRLTIDLPLAAFAVGFAYYARTGPSWKLYAVLLLAPLTRETGALLFGGYCLFLLWRRQWFRVVLFSTAALPTLGWYLVVHFKTGGYIAHLSPEYPAEAFFGRFFEPVSYALPPVVAWTAIALDYVALVGALLALIFGVRAAVTKHLGPVEIAGALFVLMAIGMGGIVGWYEPYGYPRTLSPLLMFLALRGFSMSSWWGALPLGLVLPRIGLQLGPQALGILAGLFRVGASG